MRHSEVTRLLVNGFEKSRSTQPIRKFGVYILSVCSIFVRRIVMVHIKQYQSEEETIAQPHSVLIRGSENNEWNSFLLLLSRQLPWKSLHNRFNWTFMLKLVSHFIFHASLYSAEFAPRNQLKKLLSTRYNESNAKPHTTLYNDFSKSYNTTFNVICKRSDCYNCISSKSSSQSKGKQQANDLKESIT